MEGIGQDLDLDNGIVRVGGERVWGEESTENGDALDMVCTQGLGCGNVTLGGQYGNLAAFRVACTSTRGG